MTPAWMPGSAAPADVLIADRNAGRRHSLEVVLHNAGFRCACACSPATALASLRATAAPVLLGQQGLLCASERPLLQAMRDDDRLRRETRVVVYSSRCRNLPPRFRARFPHDAFVRWTGDLESFVLTVERLIGRGGAPRARRSDLLLELLLLDAALGALDEEGVDARPASRRERRRREA